MSNVRLIFFHPPPCRVHWSKYHLVIYKDPALFILLYRFIVDKLYNVWIENIVFLPLSFYHRRSRSFFFTFIYALYRKLPMGRQALPRAVFTDRWNTLHISSSSALGLDFQFCCVYFNWFGKIMAK